jgi:CRP-like cAMP-binding protein
MALIDHSPRSATAVAATDATVVPVGEKQFCAVEILQMFAPGRHPRLSDFFG